MATLVSAREHYARQQRIARRTLLAARRARLDSLGRLTSIVVAGQLLAARDAVAAVPLMLDEQNVEAQPVGEVDPAALAGVASDGRPIESLLDLTRESAAGAQMLDLIVLTQLADAARASSSVAMMARPAVTGYARMLVPPSCARCAILAGATYKKREAFQRHPRCFPAGTVVSGPGADGATRRWYEGELVVIRTASGKELSATGNHPVLTDQGWLPANLLAEGGYVVSRAAGDRSRALLVPHEDQVPARIEDVWRSGGMSALGRVPVSTEDFHGDGVGSSHVDVVLADRLLRDGREVALLEHRRQRHLAVGSEAAITFAVAGAALELGEADLLLAGGSLRRTRLLGTVAGAHLASAEESRLAGSTYRHALLDQSSADGVAADAQPCGYGVLALAAAVGGGDLGRVEPEITTRWDAPARPFSMETRGAYASGGQDLRLRLASEVELDRVIEVRRVEWSGHVFNLTSREGWYDANGIIVSNCDCRHVPVAEATAGDLTTDPRAYFDSLPATEQERIFTKAGARAIRDGSDIGRVVNARRGMNTAQSGRLARRKVAGQWVYTTTEATSRRGISRGGRVRLMPESIYQFADSREDALRMLKAHGYIR